MTIATGIHAITGKENLEFIELNTLLVKMYYRKPRIIIALY